MLNVLCSRLLYVARCDLSVIAKFLVVYCRCRVLALNIGRMDIQTSSTVQQLLHDVGIDLSMLSDSDRYCWIQLLNRDVLGKPYTCLLKTAIDAFLHSSWSTFHEKCKMLLDITWEQLYSGHWKDIDITWRHAYTLVSFLKAVSEFAVCGNVYSMKDVMYTCDMGLLMGAPVMNNILARLATKLQQLDVNGCSTVAAEDVHTSDQQRSDHIVQDHDSILCGSKVAVEVCPSLEHFSSAYISTGTPVILRSCMDHWPAMLHNRWSPQYMQTVAGCRLVPVELGSKYTDQSWSQKLMTVNEFFERYVLNSSHQNDEQWHKEVGYLAQHQLFDQVPRLRQDIVVPDYCALSDNDDESEVDINAWFGPSGTVSPLHRDEKHNLLTQVVGAKYVRLFHPEMTYGLYRHTSHLLSTTSQVDVENPDLTTFPLFEGVTFSDCVLREGDMLYIPPMYWHYIRSLTTSFSVSFWWT